MSIIERIQKAQAEDERIDVDVPRWGCKLYFKRMDPRGFDAILKRHPTFRDNPTIGAFVDLICLRAENEDGSPAFDIKSDRITLMGEPIELINDIANKILPQSAPNVEEIEKN